MPQSNPTAVSTAITPPTLDTREAWRAGFLSGVLFGANPPSPGADITEVPFPEAEELVRALLGDAIRTNPNGPEH